MYRFRGASYKAMKNQFGFSWLFHLKTFI